MRQTHDDITQNLAERLCWEVARRDDTRVARRLYRKPEVDGLYRLDEGAVLDEFFHFLQAIGVMSLLEGVHGTAIPREMVPSGPDVVLSGLKTWFGLESMQARPPVWFRAEALMQLVGCNAQHVRQGVCQRGAAKRQGERPPGPIGPDSLAKHLVQWNVRPLEAVFNGAIRALAPAGVFGAQVTGMVAGTALETTARSTGGGQVTRPVGSADTQGRRQALAVTVDGGNVLRLVDAATTMPLAVNVGNMHAPEALWTRALGTQARLHRAGAIRRHQVVCDQGLWDGSTWWWLEQQRGICVGPAQAKMAVTAEARAQAAAGAAITVGRRAHTVRQGPGQTAWTERLEPEVVGLTGLTTSDQ